MAENSVKVVQCHFVVHTSSCQSMTRIVSHTTSSSSKDTCSNTHTQSLLFLFLSLCSYINLLTFACMYYDIDKYISPLFKSKYDMQLNVLLSSVVSLSVFCPSYKHSQVYCQLLLITVSDHQTCPASGCTPLRVM